MVFYKNRNHFQLLLPWWRWILLGLNTFALILSVILSWHYINGGAMVGCSGGSPCEQVLNSQWSMIAGVLPVSGLAVGAYLATLVAGFFIGPAIDASIRRIAWSAMLILVGSVAGSALWFTIVQKWIIGEFCLYCMITHITGLLFAAFVIWRAIKEFENLSDTVSQKNLTIVQNDSSFNPKRKNRILPVMIRSLIGLVLAGILVAFQIGFTSQVVYSDGESQDNLPTVDYHNVPIVGLPDAPYIVSFLFDYKCSHCQKIHFMLDEVVRRYGGKLAFALCPTPLNTRCNPYIPRDVEEFKSSCELAKIGLAVWKSKREALSTYDNWMFTFESGDKWHPRSLETARAKAVELVGQTKFNTAWADPWIGQYLQTCIRIYGQTIQSGKGVVPKLIFGSRWVIPEPNNADGLIMILQKRLILPKP